MKKLTLLLVASLMITAGGAFAQDKACCKKGAHCTKGCCKKDAAKSCSKSTTTTKSDAAKPKS